ncbi:hypothetical protein AAFF_G00089580 [Aldrovandia affinis]|uniref:Uncharacterized protein n=1 Tax=Aldrovandia affinis TaxID=143900 RepID=A0AAD7WD20_9TELE|nr:hypothetical protein AAFF_G00089580 [Aldrovandia affinis]
MVYSLKGGEADRSEELGKQHSSCRSDPSCPQLATIRWVGVDYSATSFRQPFATLQKQKKENELAEGTECRHNSYSVRFHLQQLLQRACIMCWIHSEGVNVFPTTLLHYRQDVKLLDKEAHVSKCPRHEALAGGQTGKPLLCHHIGGLIDITDEHQSSSRFEECC